MPALAHAAVVRVIRVERDEQTLQRAARVLFEESLVRHRMGDKLAEAERREDFDQLVTLEAELPERDGIAEGYFSRAAYLLQISTQLELGIHYGPGDVTQYDILGIRAVRAARAEFEREHPGCYRCGERQPFRTIRQCWQCGAKLGGDA